MKKGRFIVIEGGDGAGKSTQIEMLKKVFPNTVFVKEPGTTALGLAVREMTQDSTYKISVLTEPLLFFAARRQLIEEVIEPALAKGQLVIADRFNLSTAAYQFYGNGLLHQIKIFRQLSSFVLDRCAPHLYIILDVNPSVGLGRVAKRKEALTRFEQRKIDFHERVRAGYIMEAKELPKEIPHTVIDANQSLQEVHEKVLHAIKGVL